MKGDVVVVSVAVAALNALACAVGAAAWRGAALEQRPDAQAQLARVFWVLLRLAQGAAVLFALFVGVLAAAGRHSSEHLFYLYALLPLAIAFLAEQLRVASAQMILDQQGLADAAAVGALPEGEQRVLVGAIVRREIGVMAISALVAALLLARAASTAHGF